MIGLRTGLAIGGVAAVLLAAGLHLAADARVAQQRDTWRVAAEDYRAAARGWEAAYRASERRRGIEQTTARNAVNQAGKACDARVARARTSAAAIQRITHAPLPTDERGCPVRGRLDARSLSDALTPDADPD